MKNFTFVRIIAISFLFVFAGCAGPRAQNACLVMGGLAYVITKNPSVAAAGCVIGSGIGGHYDMRADEEKNKPVNKVEVGEFIDLDGGGKKAVPKSPTAWVKGARILVSVDDYSYSRNELMRTVVEDALRAKGAIVIASASERYSDENEGLGATHVAYVSTQRDRDYVVVVIRVVNKTNNELTATGKGQAYAYYYNDANYSVATQNAMRNLH